MAQADLIQLSEVKSYLNLSTTDSARDASLSRLIIQISRAIYNNINRSFIIPKIITEVYDGNGKTQLQLKNWPVISIVSLIIDTTSIPVSSGVNSSGYVFDAPDVEPPGNMQIVYLRGYYFNRGIQNIQISYLCGYIIQNEVVSLPASSPYTVSPSSPFGVWSSDFIVSFFSDFNTDFGAGFGYPSNLVKVTGVPTTGQYSVSNGVYTFAAADAGKSVYISYGYIPGDITQAALEWIAYRWAAKDRIGQASKSLGGQETVSFTNEAVPTFVAQSLQNFRRIVPC